MQTPQIDSDATPARPRERAAPAPETQSGAALQNLALLIAYDGGAFQGWQRQARGQSIQGRLEAALHTITRRETPVTGSGRTDSGVHALAQVANAHLPAGLNLFKLRSNLNGLLKPHIVVKGIVPVDPGFHARHAARGKHYRYRLHNHPWPPVLGGGRSWWIKRPLDVDAMRAAATHLLGEHDFSAFRARNCESHHAVRILSRLEVRPAEAPDCSLTVDLEANAFLQHMARIVTGTLVEVGLGHLAPDALPGILASGRRQRAAATAPPAGLHLVRVTYNLAAHPSLRAFETL